MPQALLLCPQEVIPEMKWRKARSLSLPDGVPSAPPTALDSAESFFPSRKPPGPGEFGGASGSPLASAERGPGGWHCLLGRFLPPCGERAGTHLPVLCRGHCLRGGGAGAGRRRGAAALGPPAPQGLLRAVGGGCARGRPAGRARSGSLCSRTRHLPLPSHDAVAQGSDSTELDRVGADWGEACPLLPPQGVFWNPGLARTPASWAASEHGGASWAAVPASHLPPLMPSALGLALPAGGTGSSVASGAGQGHRG